MEKFYLEKPSMSRKSAILDYFNELKIYNSQTNGTGVFAKVLEGYTFEETLAMSLNTANDKDALNVKSYVGDTYLLVRENDNKIVGMINIRNNLSLTMQKFGGNIGYGIRPTERRKGYNKINLYLGLLEFQKLGKKTVMLDCAYDNIASSKTMIALGGIFDRREVDPQDNVLKKIYNFDVDKSIQKYKSVYYGNIALQ